MKLNRKLIFFSLFTFLVLLFFSGNNILAQSTGVTIFSEEFDNLNKWTQTGRYSFTSESPDELQIPGQASSNDVANGDYCRLDGCKILLTSPLDLGQYSDVTLNFWRYVDNDLDAGEYLKVEIFDGSFWNQIYYWTAGSGNDDIWHQEQYLLPEKYLNSNFNIRFTGVSDSLSEEKEIDKVILTGVYSGTTPAPTILPSPTISPTSAPTASPTPTLTPTATPTSTPVPTTTPTPEGSTMLTFTTCDDASDRPGYYYDSSTLYLGPYTSSAKWTAGWRFCNFNIPKEAIIQQADLTVTSRTSYTSPVTLNLSAEDVDDSVAFSSTNPPSSRVLTSSIPWALSTWSYAQKYTTPNLASSIQQVINRDNWQSGNNVAVIAKLQSGTSYRRVWSLNWDSVDAGKLTLTYTLPTPTPSSTPTAIPTPQPTPTTSPSPSPTPNEVMLVVLEPIVISPKACPQGTGPGGILAANYPPEKLTQDQRQWLFEIFGNSGTASVGYGGERCGNSYDNAMDNFVASVCSSGQTGPGGIIPGGYNPEELTQDQRQWLFEIFGNTGIAPVGFGGHRCPNQTSNMTVDDLFVAKTCASGALGPHSMIPGAYNPIDLTQEERQWLYDTFGEEPRGIAPVGYGGRSCLNQGVNYSAPDRNKPFNPYPDPSNVSCYSNSTIALGNIITLNTSTVVRDNPRFSANNLFTLNTGEQITVVSGPSCEDNTIWWTIGTSDGRGGFVEETNLDPVEASDLRVISDLAIGQEADLVFEDGKKLVCQGMIDPKLVSCQEIMLSPEQLQQLREAEAKLEQMHGTLDVVGLINPLADVENAFFYAVEGRYGDAGMSVVMIVPVVDLAKVLKVAPPANVIRKGANNPIVKAALKKGQKIHGIFKLDTNDLAMLSDKALDGVKMRPDAVDSLSGVVKAVYELKPDTLSGFNKGVKQLIKYADQLDGNSNILLQLVLY